MPDAGTKWKRGTQLAQGDYRQRGRSVRREPTSLLATADRRASNLRPDCVSAMPQDMCSQSKRQTLYSIGRRTPTEWRRGAEGAPIPCIRRMRRSNPAVRPVPSDRSDQLLLAGRVPSG